jgi:copper chaperone CopZ
MRPIRPLPLLAGLVALVAAAAVALACSGSDTKVTGSFDSAGRFVLTGAWGKDGAPIANAKGMVLESFTTADNLVISASNLSGKQVCLWGEFDPAKQSMHVAGFKECPAGACEGKGAMAQSAGGGASCCASKASAATAGAGSSCAAKTDAATAAGSHCASKVDAAAAGSGSSCAAKDAAKAASAGSSCTGGTDAAAANKMASAAPKADGAVASVVYNVTGMTCGGCASKVEGAVAKLALPNVTGCTVDLEKAQAIVTTTGDIDREAVQKAITAAGFPAQPAEAPAAKS